ncbi:MAG: CusA/CzcA family heavy metal efflux RND transporter [Myxococcota bacterium]
MIGKIIDFSAKHRALVLLLVAAAAVGAAMTLGRLELDALPDLSDPQVILFTEWKGRSPSLVEDQITYPLVSALVSVPKVADVRGFSMFGMSFVYVIFQEGTDIYWARSRVLEYLGGLRQRLPEGADPTLGPDASGVGWIFQYALVDESGGSSLESLRSFQDFSLKYALSAVEGVAEVASIGGYEKQYQIVLDPVRLQRFGLSVSEIIEAVRQSNDDVGGRVLELSGREYYVRGRGYVASKEDLESIVLRADNAAQAPIRVRDVGTVSFGPELRRGLLELNGDGEAVGGIVVMRHGENAYEVIRRVKQRLEELKPSLPKGVRVEVAYDRSTLIRRSIDTLRTTLLEEMAVVSLVIILFLLHFRSALLPILSLPLSVLLAYVPMALFGIPSTIMSLGGLAIAIGATVDAEIVMIEACHKKLEQAPPGADRRALLAEAAKEVTPAIFYSLLIIAASFLPVFALNGQAGRLFRPMAATKTFVMLAAALLSVTFAPALRDLLIQGRIRSERDHPVSRLIRRVYEPFVYIALRRPKSTVALGLLAILSAVPLFQHLGQEFMPPLDEGDLLYMPSTLPGISIEEAKRQLQVQDKILMSFPEVSTVFGKVGRAESATDPAPLSMVETTIQLKPRSAWRTVEEQRFWGKVKRPITRDELIDELNRALDLAGWSNAWTMPVKARIDMLSTGVRTPLGLKIMGGNLADLERVGIEAEHLLAKVPGIRSAFYERNRGSYSVDIVPDRAALPRYGVRVGELLRLVETAIGGATIERTIEGRARYSINVRYPRDQRQDLETLREMLVPTSGAEGTRVYVPLGQLARIEVVEGPPMIRDEGGLLTSYVYLDVDLAREDLGAVVEAAKRAVGEGRLALPAGTFLKWTGQYELWAQVKERLKLALPATLFLVVLLLYLQFGSLVEVAIVLLSVPFALVGSAWLLWLLDYRLSTAVWVGVIALIGLAAQTGVVMIVYIDHAYLRRKAAGKIRNLDDIIWAHMEGTVERVRPKLMTVSTMLIGLVPLLWSTGSGADVMKRVAAPMVGGLLSSAFLTLEIIPVIYTYWRHEELRLEGASPELARSLRRSAWLVASSALLAAGLGVLPLYLDLSAVPRWPAFLACLLGFFGGTARYLWLRRRPMYNGPIPS